MPGKSRSRKLADGPSKRKAREEEEEMELRGNPLDDDEDDDGDDGDVLIDDAAESDDPIAAGIAAERVDPRIEDLNEFVPPPIDPMGPGSDPVMQPDGSYLRPPQSIGRPTRVPLWEHANVQKGVPQLRVWKDVNGIRHDVGAISSSASEEEFIHHFIHSMPKPGEPPAVFVGRPVDAQGNQIMQEFEVIRLGPDHVTLQRVRAVQEGGGKVAAAPVGNSLADTIALMQMLLQPSQLQAAQAAAEAREARAFAAQQAKQLADERIESSMRFGGMSQQITETMFTKQSEVQQAATRQQAELQAASSKQQTDFFTMIMAQQNAAAAADREREDRRRRDDEERRRAADKDAEERRKREAREDEDRRERDRRDAESRIARERVEAELKLKAEQDRADSRSREERERYEQRLREDRERIETRQREDNARLERERAELARQASEREADRNRAHQLRIHELDMQAKRDQEHAERMIKLQHTDSPQGAIEQLQKLAGGFGIDFKNVAKTAVDRFMNPPEPDGSITETIEGVTKGIGEAFVKPMIDLAKTVKQAETVRAQINAGVPPALMGEVRQGQGTPQITQQQQSGGVQQGVQQPVPNQPAPSPTDKFDLKEVRQYRSTLREVINRITNLPDAEWEETIKFFIGGEPGLIHWFTELGIQGALKDAGASQTFIDRVLNHPALNNPMLSMIPKVK